MKEALVDLMIPKGVVTVELFDARTKKLLHRERKENFIALPGKARLAWLQMDGVVNNSPFNRPGYWSTADAFNTLFLSGDTSAESPSTERYVRNPIIGWADRTSTYSGSDSMRGTVNAGESTWDLTKVHYVFDFPTNAANGTIASIGFAGFYSQPTYQNCTVQKLAPSSPVTFSSVGYGGMTWGPGNLLHYIDGNKTIHKYDPTTGQEVGTISTAAPSSSLGGFTYGGGYFWIGDTTVGKIYKLNPDGSLAQTISVNMPTVYALAYDNGYLWAATNNSNNDSTTGQQFNQRIYKLNTSGQVVLTIPNGPGSYNCDMAVDQSYIYVMLNTMYPIFTILDKNTGNVIASLQCRPNSASGSAIGCELSADGTAFYTLQYQNPENGAPSGYYLMKVEIGALGSRILLSTPIQKNNTQTLKVTYDLLYNLNPS